MNKKRIIIKMYASIHYSDWQDKFLKEGIKAGDTDGRSRDEPVILVQHRMFPYGCYDATQVSEADKRCKCKVVEFNVPLSEVYVDWDDFDVEEALVMPEDFVLDKKGETWNHWTLKQLKESTMYGSFVKQIKPEQIVAVHDGEWHEDENWYLNGKLA